MNLFKNISLFVLGALSVFLYWKGCSPCPEVGYSITKTITFPGETITVIDSSYYDKYYELLDQIPEEKPLYSGNIPIRIIKKIKTDSNKSVKSKIRRFTTPFKDVTDTYSIIGKVTSLSEGKILSTDIKYDIKSLVIENNSSRVDTMKVFETNYIVKNSLWLGMESSLDPFGKQFSGTIDFLHKKGYGIGARFEHNFDLPTNKSNSYHLKISKKIF